VPELPEVERVRRSLVPHLVGARVAAAELRRVDIAESWMGEPGALVGGATTGRALLVGGVVDRVERLGKQLAIVTTDGRAVCVHLGMTGQLRCCEAEGLTHVHCVWRLVRAGGGGVTLTFRDPRRFGGVWTYESVEALRAGRWGALGPDALGATGAAVAAGVRGSRRAVKAVLLDQGVLAGVGNIYADEALYAAGIRPGRRGDRITRREAERLAGALREVLERSIASGGSTLRDYVDADGVAGTSQLTHAVYGRGGKACLRCERPLRRGVVAGRTTVWCATCQR